MIAPNIAEELKCDFGVVTGSAVDHRLSRKTRALAARVLAGEWGSAMTAGAILDAPEAPLDRCVAAIATIAHTAPLRIDPDELLAGAATLLEATHHRIPLADIHSVSHTTVGFERVLAIGYRGLREQVEERLKRGDLDEKGRDLLLAMRACLNAAAVWHRRYVAELEKLADTSAGDQRAHYLDVLKHLRKVPENPPTTFREALQSLWMMWDFLRLCGNWSGIGRIDKMLGPYLQRDLEAGRVTRDDARELLAHFWIKGCEWIGAGNYHVGNTGDAQFYQNIVLSGVDADGQDITNEVTYLVLDVVEELHISDFPIAVRVGPDTAEWLFRRIAEVQRRGGGIVAIYNEPLILEALEAFGYEKREARDFANDGCWEIMLPGNTTFSYSPFDMLRLLQNALGLGPDCTDPPQVQDFEGLYARFLNELRKHVEAFHTRADHAHENGPPAPLVAIFVENCIEQARDYTDRGARYSVLAPHAGGIPDAANSLLAIKKLVYEEERLTLVDFIDILRSDWEGHEPLSREARRRFPLYGNDDAEADAMVRRIYDDYVSLAADVPERNGVLRPPGISTFGREIGFREHRLATAFGAKKGEILATNFGPTPGTDMRGPTALMRSFCSMNFRKLPNGVPMELKIDPGSVRGETGIDALVTLMRTFLQLGGVFLHIDVVDTDLLRDARQHPERYPNLSVRISGWSARFATLSSEWQDMIIHRTEHHA